MERISWSVVWEWSDEKGVECLGGECGVVARLAVCNAMIIYALSRIYCNMYPNNSSYFCLCTGICYGFIENFQPWLLRDMGADNWFIGFTTTIASLSSLPFLAISGSVCSKFGHVQSICFGIVCYALRCMGKLVGTPLILLQYILWPIGVIPSIWKWFRCVYTVAFSICRYFTILILKLIYIYIYRINEYIWLSNNFTGASCYFGFKTKSCNKPTK